MNLRSSADQAGWTIREAAWQLEERVLWRGSDAAGRAKERGGEAAGRARTVAEQAARRAQEAVAPLQRLIQTKLTWPLADAFRERSAAARAGITAGVAAVAVAAGVAGATIGTPSQPTDNPANALPEPLPVSQAPPPDQALQGTTPQIEVGERGAKPAPPPKAAEPPAPVPAPAQTPTEVAWQFASAFVSYEIGKSGPQTTAVFEQTAEPALAKSLAASPPRLPTGTKVPQARVLNVVLADRTKDEVTASVSLARLRAVSEVRLTLKHTDKHGWRVMQVLG